MMWRISPVLVAGFLAAACSKESADEKKKVVELNFPDVSRAESIKFAEGFEKWMQRHNRSIDRREVDVIATLHPYLLAALDIDGPESLVHLLLPDDNRTSITWNEAVDLIGSGKITAAVQSHSLHVTLVARNGAVFVTDEPSIDAVLREIEKVDPTRKFIGYATE
jgi:hypothetical protein